MVDKISKFPKYDEVWLTEMPSPVTFSKNLIIWVDDIPANNNDMVKQITNSGI
jgi:hypothetical protein